MEKLSDILKREKAKLENDLIDKNNVVAQNQSTLGDSMTERDNIIDRIARINEFLEKETELDAIFNN